MDKQRKPVGGEEIGVDAPEKQRCQERDRMTLRKKRG